MFIYNIVVRWPNGDLEGFGASSLTSKQGALDRATKKAYEKASLLKLGHNSFSILTDKEYHALSIEDKDEIQTHWLSHCMGLLVSGTSSS